jgi:protein-tyrosine kinase
MSIVEKAMAKIHGRLQATATVRPLRSGDSARSAECPVVDGVGAHRLLQLDRSALREQGLLPSLEDEKLVARQFRRVKRPLVAASMAPAPSSGRHEDGVVVVASAMPGEGKTFTTVNLAFSLALEKDISVLLIDADLLKPHVSSAFGIADEPGLVDALLDENVDVEDLVFDTDQLGLSVLSAGRRDDNATELLASRRMRELVQTMRRRDPRRILLFDSSPLLVTTESRELGEIAAQIVLVVKAGATPRQSVYDALDMFPEDKRVGLVLNRAARTASDGEYYDYYGYGAGSRARAADGGRNGADE